jgi:CheY-like chemotaxis protein
MLDEALEDSRDLLGSLLRHGVELELALGAPGVWIGADPTDIEQILMNLASNANDAMPDGGVLALWTAASEDAATLIVSDTGQGMSAATKARAFEPFFTTKPLGHGTGLGLSTVFALVRRLGGEIAIDSVVGRGTTIRIELPRVQPRSGLRVADSVPPESGGETILMVDDDPLVRLTVESHLETLGYRPITASSAEEAIEICEDPAVRVDLVMTDVMMPGILGSELTRELTRRGKHYPVLYMSAHPRQELVRNGYLEEDSWLLAKPFDATALAEPLFSILEHAREERKAYPRRVLVIDDNADIADGLKDSLAVDGREVEVAYHPDDAISIAAAFAPEVVLCDIELGANLDGFELVAMLRREPRLANTRFIALTGYEPSRYEERAREAGFDVVLAKPVEAAELERVIRRRHAS